MCVILTNIMNINPSLAEILVAEMPTKTIVINNIDHITIYVRVLELFMNNKMMIECGTFETTIAKSIEKPIKRFFEYCVDKCEYWFESNYIDTTYSVYEFLDKYIVSETGNSKIDNYIIVCKRKAYKLLLKHVKNDFCVAMVLHFRDIVIKNASKSDIIMNMGFGEYSFAIKIGIYNGTFDPRANDMVGVHVSSNMPENKRYLLDLLINDILMKGRPNHTFNHSILTYEDFRLPEAMTAILNNNFELPVGGISKEQEEEIVNFYKNYIMN